MISKDKSGKLDYVEFRGCLLSLGHEVDPNAAKVQYFKVCSLPSAFIDVIQ